MATPIRTALFDAGGVLYDRSESSRECVERLLTEAGHEAILSPEARTVERQRRREASLGAVSPGAYWDETLRLYGVEDEELRSRLVARIDAFADEVFELPAARSALTELKRRGVSIGIVTDTIYPLERKIAWLRRIGVADLIDAIACSSSLGVKKPDPRLYRAALDPLHAAPAETVFVGHDPIELEGARALGLRTVAVREDPGAVADHHLASLAELPALALFPRG